MQVTRDDTGLDEREVDPRISYPCYKSLDEFIDVKRLRALDAGIREGIRRHVERRREDYFLNLHRLDASAPEAPGAREVWLTRTKSGVPYDYLDLDKPELWACTEAADDFQELMDFIATLPFEATGRMLIIYDEAGTVVPAHRDHLNAGICHEFVWFRTNLDKPFYMLNHHTGEKLYVTSHSAWFDTVNQFHGSDPREGPSFSVRVDGRFTEEFRRLIPTPPFNPASAPALWACIENVGCRNG